MLKWGRIRYNTQTQSSNVPVFRVSGVAYRHQSTPTARTTFFDSPHSMTHESLLRQAQWTHGHLTCMKLRGFIVRDECGEGRFRNDFCFSYFSVLVTTSISPASCDIKKGSCNEANCSFRYHGYIASDTKLLLILRASHPRPGEREKPRH